MVVPCELCGGAWQGAQRGMGGGWRGGGDEPDHALTGFQEQARCNAWVLVRRCVSVFVGEGYSREQRGGMREIRARISRGCHADVTRELRLYLTRNCVCIASEIASDIASDTPNCVCIASGFFFDADTASCVTIASRIFYSL